MMVRITSVLLALAAALLLGGCGAYWEDLGAASRTAAEAQLRRAEAERQNAQAAIIDAEARGALAESQARALTTAMDANVALTRQALRLADNGEYVLVLGAVAVLALVVTLAVVISHGRQAARAEMEPLPGQRMITLESGGQVLRLVQEPGESWAEFMAQVQALASEGRMAEIQAPKEGGK